MTKTFKREIGVALLLFWGVITISYFWYADVDLIVALRSAYEAVTFGVLAYTAAAFGMHSFVTQWTNK